MTTSPLTPPVGGDVRDVDVRDLDVRGVLAEAVAERRAADRAEARLLALAAHYVDLHPVADTQLDTSQRGSPVAGTGAAAPIPEVAEHAVAGLGAVLGLSYGSTLHLVTDALTLRHRLPRLWALTHDGHLQAWKARKVAQALTTAEGPDHWFRPEVVAFLDGHISVSARHNRLPAGTLTGLVHEALLRCDPDTAEGREQAALSDRDVTFSYGRSTAPCATADLTATLDVLDALDLDHQVTDLATQMRRLGDTSPLGVRRAHALGMLANPQHTLDVFGTTHPTTTTPDAGADADEHADEYEPAAGADADAARAPACLGTAFPEESRSQIRSQIRTRVRTVATTLYLHMTLDDLRSSHASHAGHDSGTDGTGAWVEKLGPGTVDLLHDWLQRSTGVTIRPVLDITRLEPVDQHDPPHPMREAVILRDRHCVFPGCTITARSCDVDHTVPYVPLDQGGPPGQTRPDNLACLCRRHHRLKTFTTWDYQHRPHDPGGPPGPTYLWTSPHGHTLTTHLRR